MHINEGFVLIKKWLVLVDRVGISPCYSYRVFGGASPCSKPMLVWIKSYRSIFQRRREDRYGKAYQERKNFRDEGHIESYQNISSTNTEDHVLHLILRDLDSFHK